MTRPDAVANHFATNAIQVRLMITPAFIEPGIEPYPDTPLTPRISQVQTVESPTLEVQISLLCAAQQELWTRFTSPPSKLVHAKVRIASIDLNFRVIMPFLG